MDPTPAPYMIRINAHLGATVLSAFPAMTPQWHGAHTVLTGLLDGSALYGVLAEIEALGLDLLEVRPVWSHRPEVALQWLLQLAPNVLLIPGPAPPVTCWTTLPSSTWR